MHRNSSEAMDDMEGMIALFNQTELEPLLPEQCEEVIAKLRESGFYWKLSPKVRSKHLKFVVGKCVSIQNEIKI